MTSNKVVLDIEANGLKPDKIWCIVTRVPETGETKTYTQKNLREFNVDLANIDEIIGHNILGYDVPVLERLLGSDFTNVKLTDTLVMSRLFKPTREGGHSLKVWGEKIGNQKGDFTDFAQYSEEMLEYCINDVAVNVVVYLHLLVEAQGFSEQSIQLEMDVHKIIAEQVSNGWLLDEQRAFMLLAELKESMLDAEAKVHERFKPLPIWVTKNYPKNPLKKDGTEAAIMTKHREQGFYYDKAEGSYGVYEYPIFNLGSRQQIGRYLMHYGWTPVEFTETGKPKVDEKVLEGVDIPEAVMIKDFLLLQKRVGMVLSWIEAVEDDGRVHGYVNPIGAQTNRMTHSNPNVAQVPAAYSPYGKECRECWVVPKGYKLVGCDASGLELRMLAHYLKDDAYLHQILDGDIHSYNQEMAGLETRDQAKTMIYALCYGAGDAKLGTIINGSAADGKKLKATLFRNIPSLGNLITKIKKASHRGYLKGLDGRKIWVKSEHSAPNYLLQSAGAIVMKKALVLLYNKAKGENLDFTFVGNIHDEYQTQVLEDHSERFGELAVEAIVDAGIALDMYCPLDGESKIGDNWYECH
jgi:DNA polymerase I-like protein with 3'-5' exonuclease and polymerase domains